MVKNMRKTHERKTMQETKWSGVRCNLKSALSDWALNSVRTSIHTNMYENVPNTVVSVSASLLLLLHRSLRA